MIYFIILFILVNVLVGLFLTIILSQSNYKLKKTKLNSELKLFEEVKVDQKLDKVDDNLDGHEEEIVLNENDQDKVITLAKELIPKNEDHLNPKSIANNEMEKKVKGYFDSNINEATKIFKTMLKNK